jgi:hypothetical protein
MRRVRRGAGGVDELPAGYADHHSEVYGDDPHWLCKPGIADYPTTSFDQGASSDFTPGESEEISTAYNQVARLTSTWRVFAPI